MTLEQVFFISQTAAAIGVMASLIFVGLEIRNNARAVRSATAQSVHENYATWYLHLADNESARAASVKGFSNLASLSPEEKTQFVCTYMAFLSHSQNAFHQWRDGHLAKGLRACWEALMMNLVNTPGGATFWGERGYVFDSEFRREVEDIMKREPNPVARALGVVPVRHRTGAQLPGAM
jgi:hypothetical protein